MASLYNIVQADLDFSEIRLKQLTDDAATTIDTAKVDRAIAAAEKELHLYVAPFYEVPLRTDADAVPDGVGEKLIAAARWFLMQNRAEMLRGDSDEGKQWEARRKEHLAWLGEISDPDKRKRRLIAGAVEKGGTETRGGTATVVSDVPFFGSSTGGFF
jgi:phage gp36-like protein